MIDIETLIDDIKARIEDPERQEIVVQMGIDLVEITALQASDPELAEVMLRHAKAQALALAATEAKVVGDAFMKFATDAARTLITAAFAAA